MSETSKPKTPPDVLDEFWLELQKLEGTELDAYLQDLGLNPEKLLESYSETVASAVSALKHRRFEEAKKRVRERKNQGPSNVTALPIDRKRQIASEMAARARQTNDMTQAARKQSVVSERDLDSTLEAYVRLGIIDDDGNFTT